MSTRKLTRQMGLYFEEFEIGDRVESTGRTITEGDVVMIMEAMKMETEIRAAKSGIVLSIPVKEGDAIQVGTTLLILG